MSSPSYVMVKKKFMFAILFGLITLLLLVLAAFQYTNYVSRQLCGLISLSDNTYKQAPPSSATGIQMAKEFDRVSKKYHCG